MLFQEVPLSSPKQKQETSVPHWPQTHKQKKVLLLSFDSVTQLCEHVKKRSRQLRTMTYIPFHLMIQHNCSQQDSSIHRMLTALAWEKCQGVQARHTNNCRAPQNYTENFLLVQWPLLRTAILLQLSRKHKISCILNQNVGSCRNNLINNDLPTVADSSG